MQQFCLIMLEEYPLNNGKWILPLSLVLAEESGLYKTLQMPPFFYQSTSINIKHPSLLVNIIYTDPYRRSTLAPNQAFKSLRFPPPKYLFFFQFRKPGQFLYQQRQYGPFSFRTPRQSRHSWGDCRGGAIQSRGPSWGSTTGRMAARLGGHIWRCWRQCLQTLGDICRERGGSFEKFHLPCSRLRGKIPIRTEIQECTYFHQIGRHYTRWLRSF